MCLRCSAGVLCRAAVVRSWPCLQANTMPVIKPQMLGALASTCPQVGVAIGVMLNLMFPSFLLTLLLLVLMLLLVLQSVSKVRGMSRPELVWAILSRALLVEQHPYAHASCARMKLLNCLLVDEMPS